MGMYTQLNIGLELKKALPSDVKHILEYMVGEPFAEQPKELPDHALFKTERWRFMLRCSSYYHTARSVAIFCFDEIGNSHYLTVISSFKNYNNEIALFLDWIKQYLVENHEYYIGTMWYEKDDAPTAIFLSAENDDFVYVKTIVPEGLI